jgi:hypothetical protein
MSGRVSINLPEDNWEEIGDSGNPRARLLASIRINGVSFHVEAVQVSDTRLGVQVFNPQTPDWIKAALQESSDYDGMHTVKIGRLRYLLIITPYAR